MKWFMFVVFVHISQYGSKNPTDVVFFQMDQQYDSMDECINDQPKQTIEQLKKSVQEKGLLDPLFVKNTNGHLKTIVGNNRMVICKELGIKTIP